jgi:hypothetical protein
MRAYLIAAAIAACWICHLAFAGPIRVCTEVPHSSVEGSIQIVNAASFDDPPSPAFTDTFAWNNWTTPLWPYFGGPGRTNIGPPLIIGSHEVGEDMQLVPGTGGIWSDRGYTIYNGSASEIVTEFRQTFRWYSMSGSLLYTFTLLVGFSDPLRPGESALIFTGPESYLGRNYTLPEQFYFTVQFSQFTNYDVNNVGMLTGGPITDGSSSHLARDFTTGQSIDLGDQYSNIMFYIRTRPVPSPSAASLLAASSLLALRRRRTTKAEY